MSEQRAATPGDASWSVADIPYEAVDREAVRNKSQLFYVVASASFIEITSDLFTRALGEFFEGDAEVTSWLERGWEPEELQHGEALKRYVQAAWPDFDWAGTYRAFRKQYAPYCSAAHLAPTRALEMAARCVVETGTATFYRMLADASPEPVLRQLAANIQADEVRHYKHFYRAFERYRSRERPGRVAILRTLLAEVNEIDSEDGYLAFKHVFLARNPGAVFHDRHYLDYRQAIRRIASRHYPTATAVKMLLKPLGLPSVAWRLLLPPVTAATRLFVLR